MIRIHFSIMTNKGNLCLLFLLMSGKIMGVALLFPYVEWSEYAASVISSHWVTQNTFLWYAGRCVAWEAYHNLSQQNATCQGQFFMRNYKTYWPSILWRRTKDGNLTFTMWLFHYCYLLIFNVKYRLVKVTFIFTKLIIFMKWNISFSVLNYPVSWWELGELPEVVPWGSA